MERSSPRRVAVLGGTRFIGAAIVEELVEHGHEVTLIHRGETERDDLPQVAHAHLDRTDTARLRRVLADTGAQVLIDTCAYSRADAAGVVAALHDELRLIVLSSMDTYRQFHRLRTEQPPLDPLPLDEDSPTRRGEERYLFRGQERSPGVGASDVDVYENLDVEEVVLARGATVLRLAMVYGERDPMLREEFILRGVRAGAERIDIGAGTLLCTRAWVRDVARAVRLTVTADAVDGLVLNIGERRTLPMLGWAQAILDAAGSNAQLTIRADAELDGALALTGALSQHILVDSHRARRLLGWQDSDADTAIRASVAWHLDHPPT